MHGIIAAVSGLATHRYLRFFFRLFDCTFDRFRVMLFSGFGGVFTATFSALRKRRWASDSLN
jgi:hypothetical protein